MKRLPNFLIVGANRCGTTSLHYYLNEHPQVFMAPRKELRFFTHDSKYIRGLGFYESFDQRAESELLRSVVTY